jgi:hypothetical protein
MSFSLPKRASYAAESLTPILGIANPMLSHTLSSRVASEAGSAERLAAGSERASSDDRAIFSMGFPQVSGSVDVARLFIEFIQCVQ